MLWIAIAFAAGCLVGGSAVWLHLSAMIADLEDELDCSELRDELGSAD